MSMINIEESALKTIAEMVYQNSGIVFKESNLSVLTSRLSTKLKEKKLDIDDYIRLLKNDHNELMSFIDFATTNFTSFFRNERHFDVLREDLLPMLVEKKTASSNRTLKIWSAGCSTGEETYTIAIVVYNYFKTHRLDLSQWEIRIMGSDISLDSLFIAKAGKYPARSVQKIEENTIQSYFDPIEDDHYYILKDFIRDMVRFDFHNLIYDSNINGVDIAFCRNVLIYFDEDIQRKVVDKIHKAMNPEGYLFIGHSESLVGLYEGFKPQSIGKGIVYVKQ